MSGRRYIDAAALLHDLLNRHEARPAAQRVLARIDEASFASVQDEAACMARLEAAERAGGVRIVRRRVDGVERVQHVALTNADALYGHLQRAPSRQTVDDALSALRQNATPELNGALDEIAEAWRRNVSRFGLSPGDAVALAKSLRLVAALQSRANNPGGPEVDYRTFSRAAVDDSKALDRLKGPALRLLQRLAPAMAPAGLDEAETLASLGVVRLSQPFLASGPLALAGAPLPSLTYVGVPPDAIDGLTLVRGVDYLLTVENFTSFVRHSREVNGDQRGLVLYSGGFPSRTALQGIVHLALMARAPTFHWGDLDAGGLRIFRHLETALGEASIALRPHLMTEALLAQGQAQQPKALRLKLGDASASAIAELWDAMARSPQALEQEALDPVAPI